MLLLGKKKKVSVFQTGDLIKATKSESFWGEYFRAHPNESKSQKVIDHVGEFRTLGLVKPPCHIALHLEQGCYKPDMSTG